MTDRNRTYQNGRVSTHSDVQCGSANRQTSFSGRGNARIKLPFSGHIANKFRRPTILQLNIKGLTASKMLCSLRHSSSYCRRPTALITNVFTLAILTVDMLTGVTTTTVRTVSAWLAGQVLIVLPCYTMPRTLPVFIPAAETLAPIRI